MMIIFQLQSDKIWTKDIATNSIASFCFFTNGVVFVVLILLIALIVLI